MGGVDSQAVEALAYAAGLGPVQVVAPFAGGANNRVFRVETPTSVALLKSYFRHPDDPRDRLATDFAFSRFAWDSGVRCIPQPLACDSTAGLGLFEYVYGRSLAGSTAGEAAVDQAIEFYRTLNRSRNHPDAVALPTASEACFSLADHFAMVARRVSRLQAISVVSDVDFAAQALVESQLVPTWDSVLAAARQGAFARGLAIDQPLDTINRCLSPSDFGYHNALLANDGRLRFIDFEYAGWDDPSKLVCDFFCQPAVPAPAGAFERFAHAVAAELPEPELHVARASLLLPVYRVKWVCIILNEFLPVGSKRRAFSSAAELETRKVTQLSKARAALAAVNPSTTSSRKVA
jgi:hypothetical protein